VTGSGKTMTMANVIAQYGKPTLVLSQKDVIEWRWRADRAGRSVWYPSAQVIRQPARGDWAGAVEAVKARWP